MTDRAFPSQHPMPAQPGISTRLWVATQLFGIMWRDADATLFTNEHRVRAAFSWADALIAEEERTRGRPPQVP